MQRIPSCSITVSTVRPKDTRRAPGPAGDWMEERRFSDALAVTGVVIAVRFAWEAGASKDTKLDSFTFGIGDCGVGTAATTFGCATELGVIGAYGWKREDRNDRLRRKRRGSTRSSSIARWCVRGRPMKYTRSRLSPSVRKVVIYRGHKLLHRVCGLMERCVERRRLRSTKTRIMGKQRRRRSHRPPGPPAAAQPYHHSDYNFLYLLRIFPAQYFRKLTASFTTRSRRDVAGETRPVPSVSWSVFTMVRSFTEVDGDNHTLLRDRCRWRGLATIHFTVYHFSIYLIREIYTHTYDAHARANCERLRTAYRYEPLMPTRYRTLHLVETLCLVAL